MLEILAIIFLLIVLAPILLPLLAIAARGAVLLIPFVVLGALYLFR